MKFAKHIITILVLLTLASCGGGSVESNGVSSPVVVNPIPAETSIFTQENTPDIAVVMLLMGEGVIDVSELIESEFLWFYHAPQEITTRDCLEGGKVIWELASEDKTRNSGKLTFLNCLNEKPYPDYSEFQPSIFNGEVDITFTVDQFSEKLEYTGQNIIKSFDLEMSTSELLITQFGDDVGIPISFSLTSKVEQEWEDNSTSYLQSAKKVKTVEIVNFNVPFFENQSEQLNQGSMNQYESYTPNSDGFQYHYTLSAGYKSEKYAYDGSLVGEITVDELIQNQDYSQRAVSGRYELKAGAESITSSFRNDFLRVSSTSGYIGDASTYQILEDINFRLVDNNAMYLEIQKRTPFVSVDFEQNLQTDDYATLVFNKHLEFDRISTGLAHPFGFTLSAELAENKLLVPISSIRALMETFDVSDIDLLLLRYSVTARFFQPTQTAEGVSSSVSVSKGTILQLSDTVNNIFSLPSKNEFISSKISSNTSTTLRFNELGNKIEEKLFQPLLTSICVDQATEQVFATRVTLDNRFQLLKLDNDLNIESETDLNLQTMNNVKVICNSDSITFLDTDFRQSFFKYSNQELIELDPYSSFTLFGQHSFVLNPVNDKQVFVLHDWGYTTNSGDFQPGLRIGVIDYESSPVTTKILDIDESQLQYPGAEPQGGVSGYHVFTDEVTSTLLFYNLVIDLENGNQVLHKFRQVSDKGEVEYVRYINSTSRIIVTSHAIYDADDFSELFVLPYIARRFTAERWFVDGSGRLNLSLGNFGSATRDKTIIYQTPVFR